MTEPDPVLDSSTPPWVFPILALAFALLVLSFCHPAPAGAGMFEDDVAWIEDNSGLRWEGTEPPDVVDIPAEVLWNLCGRGCIGTYDPWVHTVYLDDALNPDERRITLFHEHVHAVQYSRAHVPDDTCPGLLEPMAYKLEFAWGDAHGYSYEPGTLFHGFSAASACRMREMGPGSVD